MNPCVGPPATVVARSPEPCHRDDRRSPIDSGETFGPRIGTKPEGVIVQFAMYLLLYNLIQVVRGVIAVGVQRQREEISGEKLFEDVQRQMIAWSETVEP